MLPLSHHCLGLTMICMGAAGAALASATVVVVVVVGAPGRLAAVEVVVVMAPPSPCCVDVLMLCTVVPERTQKGRHGEQMREQLEGREKTGVDCALWP
jgi:hypothetical protein